MHFQTALTMALAASVAAFAADGVYRAPDPEPSADEVYILELINRFRADPHAEADVLMAEGEKFSFYRGQAIDWEMFKREMLQLKSARPLVMNLKLLDAARKHSHYIIQHEMTHSEKPGQTGFTGATPSDRAKAAGYSSGWAAENIYREAWSPLYGHGGFVVDFGEGPGGMQTGRGHRVNMINEQYREAGCGSLKHGREKFAITHNFSSRDVPRLAGGVIYSDKNGNRFYDPGEGIGGVSITASDGSSTKTWKSGGYALEMKSTQAGVLTAEIDGAKFAFAFDAGADNLKFDVRAPDRELLLRVDIAMTAVESQLDPQSPARFKAAVALHHAARGVTLDSVRRKRVNALTLGIGAELEKSRHLVKCAMKDVDTKALLEIAADKRQRYSGTVEEAWFKDAERLAAARRCG